ncbi:MAG TPA: GatB/YqeY domain-containing protein [Terriglobia bacterium]|nr:GatB/YqeY domain-containing protein [Terriglobia bacterium]
MPMTISEQVEKDLVAAMKAREELRLSVLRMAKTALKHKQVELGKVLSDDEAAAVLRTLVKQRRDSVEQFRKGGREDLAAKEEAETEILLTYLPAAASDEEIGAAVAAAIAETGSSGPQDLGKVMKVAMQKLAGKNADGKRVSQTVRARLGG